MNSTKLIRNLILFSLFIILPISIIGILAFANIIHLPQNLVRLPGIPVACHQNTSGEYSEVFDTSIVKNYDMKYEINSSGDVNITEVLDVYFSEEKRGIYRYIPLFTEILESDNKYNLGQIKISDIYVTREGIAEKFTVTESTADCVTGELNRDVVKNKVIKIGNASKYLPSGTYKYEIKYNLKNWIYKNNLTNDSSIYWNFIGNNLRFRKVNNINIDLIFPYNLSDSVMNFRPLCWSGSYGSQDQNCIINISNNVVNIKKSTLLQNEALTVRIDLPSNISQNFNSNFIISVDRSVSIKDLFIDLLVTIIPLLGIIYMLFIKLKFSNESKRVIAPLFKLPNMSAAMSGVIYDQTIDNGDISAIFISLAIKGHIKIEKIKAKNIFGTDTYAFINRNTDTNVKSFLSEEEAYLYEKLFLNNQPIIEINELKYNFYSHVQKIKEIIKNVSLKNQYFTEFPSLLHIKFIPIYIMFALSIYMIYERFNIVLLLFNIIFVFIFIYFIARYKFFTNTGVRAYEDILGLREYINLAEKDRLNVLNDPDTNIAIFEKYLPYAMALGVVNIWVDKFKNISNYNPDWYYGSDTGGMLFNYAFLTNDLNRLSNTINANIMLPPSSKFDAGSLVSGGIGSIGGGFSGGGGGGGGGGSW